jgi:hypothetical protein
MYATKDGEEWDIIGTNQILKGYQKKWLERVEG